MSKEEVLKVVRRMPDGSLFSARVSGYGAVKYEEGKPTFPPAGPLYAFSSLQGAQKFAIEGSQDGGVAEIYRAEGETTEDFPLIALIVSWYESISTFWEIIEQRGGIPDSWIMGITYRLPPQDTVLCSSITLKEFMESHGSYEEEEELL